MHTAIVPGVSRGLGAALAAALLERDFVVLGVGRGSHPRLTGERYRFVRFDLADAARVDETLAPEFSALAGPKPASACLLNNAATAGAGGAPGRGPGGGVGPPLAGKLAAGGVLTQ